MFGRINWSRWILLLAIVLSVALSNATIPGRSQVGGATQSAPNLTGKWKLDTGETIEITQTSSGQVVAKFSPLGRCWDDPRQNLFTGQVRTQGSGNATTFTISNGVFWACTRNEKMWKECGLEKIFETKFRATVSPFSITGEIFRDGYYLPDGDFRKCRPDSRYDEWAPFSLTPLCAPDTPWFDRGAAASCQDARGPVVISDSIQASVSICGSVVFEYRFRETDQSQNYGVLLQSQLTRQVGSKVCCDKFRQTVPTGGCDPRLDIDCDGRPNLSDTIVVAGSAIPVPDINIFSTALGASVAPFPEGLNPDDPGFVPASSGCDCKWQLINGVLNCGTGGQQHAYVATWKCPTTGAQVTTTKTASANAPCP